MMKFLCKISVVLFLAVMLATPALMDDCSALAGVAVARIIKQQMKNTLRYFILPPAHALERTG